MRHGREAKIDELLHQHDPSVQRSLNQQIQQIKFLGSALLKLKMEGHQGCAVEGGINVVIV